MFAWLFPPPLKVGEPAPDFELPDESGNLIRLSSSRGRHNVILVWYPGDDTRICTQQLCALRDAWGEAARHDALVFGISPQGSASHQRFRAKYALPFPLLVDQGQRAARLYRANGLIVKRTVYAIGKDGRIRGAWRGNPPPAEVLSTVESG